MNSSRCTVYPDDRSILEGVNKEKAALLAPAIFYSVFLMIIGIVGNPIAIYIYGWKWQNTTTRIFLFWLACLDLLNCVVTMPTEIYVLSSFYYFPNEGFCRLSRFFTYFINNSTSAIFLTIAWDRYIRICHPHRQAMSLTGSKIACFVSLFIGLGVSWPALFLYGRKIVPLPRHRPSSDGGSGGGGGGISGAVSSSRSYSENGSSSIISSGGGVDGSVDGSIGTVVGTSIECASGSVSVKGIICDIRNEMDDTPYPLAFFIYLWCAVSMCVLILAVFYSLIGRVILKRRRQKKLKEMNNKKAADDAAAVVEKPVVILPRSQSESGLDNLNLNYLAPHSVPLSSSSTNNTNTSPKTSKVQTCVELTTKDNNPYVVTTTTARTRSRSNSDCAVDTTCAEFPHFRFSGRRIRPPKSTLMLFAITAVFILSFLPFLIITIIRQNKGPTFYPSLTSVQEVVVNIFLRFYLLNNCTNPIVYGLCNSQFRRELRKLFRVPLLRRESSMSRGESCHGVNGGIPY